MLFWHVLYLIANMIPGVNEVKMSAWVEGYEDEYVVCGYIWGVNRRGLWCRRWW